MFPIKVNQNNYAIITDLCPHSLYSISVRACTNDTETANVCGPYSRTIQAQMLKDHGGMLSM